MQTAFAFERTNRNYSLQHCRRISFNSYPRETYMCCLLQEVGGAKYELVTPPRGVLAVYYGSSAAAKAKLTIRCMAPIAD